MRPYAFFEENDLRPEVRNFARAMEARLRLNEGKGGWKGESTKSLLVGAYQNLSEAQALLHCKPKDVRTEEDESAILIAAADAANYAMMLADVAGTL
jgi:hypothetical protein